MTYAQVVQAVRRADIDGLRALLEGEVELAPSGQASATWVAAAGGVAVAVTLLGERDRSTLRGLASGLTPASVAASIGHADVIRAIGALDPEALALLDASGQGPVHHAAANGHLDALRAIAELAPAELGRATSTGLTAMDIAWNLGHADCVQLLIDHGQQSVAEKWRCGCSPGEACGPAAPEVD